MITLKEYLDDRAQGVGSLSQIEYNKQLVAEFPFLQTNKDEPTFLFTWMDDMPNGWRLAFGREFLEELKAALEKEGKLDSYEIAQVKEKYGELRWYDYGCSDEVYKIIDKYSELSAKTCFICGKPAKHISLGWVCPWCDDCAMLNYKAQKTEEPFDTYFKKIDVV